MDINAPEITLAGNSTLVLEQNSDERFARVVGAFLLNLGSPGTAAEYGRAAREFFAFIAPHVDHLSALRREHLIVYKRWIMERGQSNQTVRKKLSALSSLFKFMAHEGLVERDITYGVTRPKEKLVKETAALTEEEVRLLFEERSGRQKMSPSHRAILAVGFYTGLRSAEIRSLKVGNLAEVNGHRVIVATIKGDKRHEIPLNPFVVHCLNGHLAALAARGANLTPQHHLFPRLHPQLVDKPISAKSLRQIFLTKLAQAGIPLSTVRRHSPHTMRTTLATHLLNKVEAQLEDVQKLLGHASPTTTQRYNKRLKSHNKSPVYRIDY